MNKEKNKIFFEKKDFRLELDLLEKSLKDLKVLYEQFFTGILPLAPEKEHAALKRILRDLIKAPLKSQAISFRLRTIESRYNTFNTYWQRVIKQREEGTFSKDIFKANLRERIAKEEARAETREGQAEKSLQKLFETYKSELEKSSGQKQNLDFGKFQKNISERAKELKAKHSDKKVSFKIVKKDGKISIQATLKGKD